MEMLDDVIVLVKGQPMLIGILFQTQSGAITRENASSTSESFI